MSCLTGKIAAAAVADPALRAVLQDMACATQGVEGDVTTLQGNVTVLQGDVAILQAEVASIITEEGGVANPASLTLIDDSALGDGNHRYVISDDQFYVLDKTNTTPIDGNLVVATMSGTGRWIQYPYRSLFRTSWFVTGTSGAGDDTADGSALTPLRTIAEAQRRIGRHRGQIPAASANVTVTLTGNTTEQVHLDFSTSTDAFLPHDSLLVLTGVPSTPATTEAITVVTPPGGSGATALNYQVTLPTLPLAVGDIIRWTAGARITATARVIQSLGGGVYEISTPVLPTTSATPGSTTTPTVGDFVGVVTFPVVDGEFYIASTGRVVRQYLQIQNTQVTAPVFGLILDGGNILDISCLIIGATLAAGGINRLNDNCTHAPAGCFFQLTVPIQADGGKVVMGGGNYFTGGAGYVSTGGGIIQTAAYVCKGPTTASLRSYLTAGPGGVLNIGSGMVTRGTLSGIWVQEGGFADQVGTTTAPTGTVITAGEGIRVESGGRYVFKAAPGAPTIASADVASEVNLGGIMVLYSTLPATNGVDTPRCKYITSGGAAAVPTATTNHGFATANGVRASAGVYTLTTVVTVGADDDITVNTATQDTWGVGVRTGANTIVVHTYATVADGALGAGHLALTAADADFTVSVVQKTGANGASMVIRSPTA